MEYNTEFEALKPKIDTPFTDHVIIFGTPGGIGVAFSDLRRLDTTDGGEHDINYMSEECNVKKPD